MAGNNDIAAAEQASELPQMGFLTVASTGERLEFELPASFGRGQAASFKLMGNPVVQRLHFSIFPASGREMIKDLTCVANAVFVNGRGLPSRGSRFIKPGAVISVGDEDYAYGGLLSEDEMRRYVELKAAREAAKAAAEAEVEAESAE